MNFDPAWLHERYIEQGMSTPAIAAEVGCSHATVHKALVAHGIPRRPVGGQMSHGRTNSPEYTVWQNIIAACENPNVPDYRTRGARGICVCPEWRASFDAFVADMGERPAGKVLSRINLDDDYSPRNCRWATAASRNRNRDRGLEIVVAAAARLGTFTLREIAIASGRSPSSVGRHLRTLADKGIVSLCRGAGPRPHEWTYVSPTNERTIASRATRPTRVRGFAGGGAAGGVDLPADKDMRNLARRALAAGAQVRRSGSDHFIVTSPKGERVTISNTPSSRRAVANARADLQRAGLPV